MATAEELLGTITDVTDEFLTVNLDTRIIVIPASIKILGVESDDDVKRIRFKLPRNYGEFDLSTFSIQVNFENADGEGDFYLINDLDVSDDGTMTFTWLVDRTAFKRHGDVDFSLCMKKFDAEGVVVKEFNTAIASLPVLKGLETTKAVVENNVSAFDSVLFRLYAVEAATGNSTNGYYTVASVNETDEGVEISIIGSDGVSVATIKHGQDGQDGRTPVKGIDYWTDEDKNAIRNDYLIRLAPISVSVTLFANSWNDNLQTVTVEGVTSDSIVLVAPALDKSNRKTYSEAGVYCTAQDGTTLTFECETIPDADVMVDIGVFRTVYDPDAGETGGVGNSGSAANIPNFNLIEMGLPAVPIDGSDVSVNVDTTDLFEAFDKGLVKITFTVDAGDNGSTDLMDVTTGICYSGVWIVSRTLFALGAVYCYTIEIYDDGDIVARCREFTALEANARIYYVGSANSTPLSLNFESSAVGTLTE